MKHREGAHEGKEKTFGPQQPEGTRWLLENHTQRVIGVGTTAFKAAAQLGWSLAELVQTPVVLPPKGPAEWRSVTARDVLPGDTLLVGDEPRDVVRVYPHGLAGNASFAEISFGSVCVSFPREELVWVQR